MELPLWIYIYFGFTEEERFNQLKLLSFGFPLNSLHMANQSVLLNITELVSKAAEPVAVTIYRSALRCHMELDNRESCYYRIFLSFSGFSCIMVLTEVRRLPETEALFPFQLFNLPCKVYAKVGKVYFWLLDLFQNLIYLLLLL